MTTEVLDVVEETTESTRHRKIPRVELVDALVERDGTKCMFPGCGSSLNFDITEGPLEVTIDHWTPQWYGKEHGWTWDEIWDLGNLKLMHKKCNAKKGERVPDENGVLPDRAPSTFRYRRQRRANRPTEPCAFCDNGHNLMIGEVCAQCGVNAQNFPRWAKAKYADCDHAAFWCIWCSIGVVERAGAVEMIFLHGEGGEQFDL